MQYGGKPLRPAEASAAFIWFFSVPAPSIRSNTGRRGFSTLPRAHQETRSRVAADVARFGIEVHAFLGQPALDTRARGRSSGDADSRPAGGLCSGARRCR